MRQRKKYWTEIAANLSGEMNKKQVETFLEKVKTNKQLNKDYIVMKKTWNNFNSNPDEKYSDTGEAWKSLNNRIAKEGMHELDQKVVQMTGLQYTLRIAAIVLLILTVGIPVIYYSANEISKGKAVIEHKSVNGILTIDLPDGSRVFLNEGARLELEKTFEENRDVTLEGEGYFDVMSDPNRPFRVNAGKVVVTVLGTSFNIKESDNETIQVFVESGMVQVDMETENETIVLEPGQIAEANNHLSSSILQDANYLSWKTKDFKFVDESILSILTTLEQAYHVEVRADDISLSNMRLTTTYSDQSFDAILTTICTALNMNYKKKGKVYILHSN